MRKFLPILMIIYLTGCATVPADPSLALGVERKGPGLYSVSELSAGFGGMTNQAVKQCQIDGKKLVVEATTTQTGVVSGTAYPLMLFRCV